jgi:hypothetical protein
MQWLGTPKYTIFLKLLISQNLWNLINVLIEKIYEFFYLNVCYDFSKFDESKKSRCDVPSDPPKDVFACQVDVHINSFEENII